jgi:hypothetical protein
MANHSLLFTVYTSVCTLSTDRSAKQEPHPDNEVTVHSRNWRRAEQWPDHAVTQHAWQADSARHAGAIRWAVKYCGYALKEVLPALAQRRDNVHAPAQIGQTHPIAPTSIYQNWAKMSCQAFLILSQKKGFISGKKGKLSSSQCR